MDDEVVLLDDGHFHLVLNGNYPADRAPGFLLRRCTPRANAPDGLECIGRFRQHPDGTWCADIEAPAARNDEDDVLVLGIYDQRLDAIHALWHARHQPGGRGARP